MSDKPWRLFKRKSRWRRRAAERGNQYDGSRWELHKRYDAIETALSAMEKLQSKESAVYPMHQFKILHQTDGRP